MTMQQRAAKFAPFDAIKGLKEALLDREERYNREQRREFSDEILERNSLVISKLQKGSRVRIHYYFGYHDVTKIGTVSEISIAFKFLIFDHAKIFFEDIYNIQLL